MSNIDKIIYSDIPFFRVHTSVAIMPKNMSAIDLLKRHFFTKNADIINAASSETIKYLKVVFLKGIFYKVYNDLHSTYMPNKKKFKELHLINIKMFLKEAIENDSNCGLKNTFVISSPQMRKHVPLTELEQRLLSEGCEPGDLFSNEYIYKNIEEKTYNTPSKPSTSIGKMAFTKVDPEFKTPEKANLIKTLPYLSVLNINKLDNDEIEQIPPTIINNIKPKQAHLLSKEVIKNLSFKTIEQLDLGIVSEFSTDAIIELIERIKNHNINEYNELSHTLHEVTNDRRSVSPLKLPKGVPLKIGAQITNSNKRRDAARKITFKKPS